LEGGNRISVTREINEAGLEIIEQHEGLKLEAYQDQRGVWTIGYGHTRGVFPGMTFNIWQAQTALHDDLSGAEAVVEDTADGVDTSENEFSAMVSLCFNIGSGNFRASSVLKSHLAGDKQAAADGFLLWDKTHINGVLQPDKGLLARRQDERALYLTPDAAAPASSLQKAA